MHTIKRYIQFYLIQLIFWISIFSLFRLVFLLAYFNKVKTNSFSEITLAFFKGFRLDISTICYLSAIPLILFFVNLRRNRTIISLISKLLTLTLAAITAIISIAEILLYGEWGTKLNYKALSHLSQPSEVFKTATWSQTILFFTGIVLFILFANKWLKVLSSKINNSPQEVNPASTIIVFLACVLLTGIGIRGGLQQIPINQSDCYYSSNHTLNLIAINPSWNLLHSITENYAYGDSNPYEVMEIGEARNLSDKIHHTSTDSTIQFINNQRPNIVLIILEGWSADMVSACGGDKGFTPQLEKIAEEGVLFTNIYSSGSRSDQGMACILSGFPAQPKTSIIAQANKYPKLPCITPVLKKEKYYTSYYFGGQLSYGNIKGYLVYNNFDKITEIYDFDPELPQGKLGLHDEYVLNRQLRELKTHPQPFFSALFTASTHSPYDMPIKKWRKFNSNEEGYMNAVCYADSCLGNYFRDAKKEEWYKNTLFVIVPDHSHNTHKNHEFDSPEYRKIPMLFAGEVIKNEFKGTLNPVLGSQIDMISTLLNQMKINSSEFTWSKNLMNPTTKTFAYYACEEGLGWISERDTFNYYYHLKQVANDKRHSANKDSVLKVSQAYLETLFQQYLDY